MICLTCDVHHMSLKTGNQLHSDRSEASIAAHFAKLLEQRQLNASYFVSGKCFEEEWLALKPICHQDNIEIGGHTYNCFEPALWHRGCNKLIGSYNGPRWQQNWDIAKTKSVIQKKTGRSISSWRNHMYMHGPYTEALLMKNGISVCCDGVKRHGSLFEKHATGLINFPINIIPDHEHLYHAERTPEWVESWIKRYNWSDDYGSQSYYFSQWLEILKTEVLWREANGLVSHLLIHPITLYLCQGFEALEMIADFLSQFDTIQVSKLVQQALGPDKTQVKESVLLAR
ncbi:MAG: polysaccharide deacetylase family protein [Pseudomonadales bacterium]|nr:polysaccharide deacetylase family protein [Pseudomonadales bacterium]